MLQVNFIRQNKERVLQGLKTRNFKDEQLGIIDEILALDETRKETQTELDHLRNEINSISKEIGGLFKSGNAAEANAKKSEVSAIKEKMAGVEEKMNTATDTLEALLLKVPNVPHPTVPPGNSDEDNEVSKPFEGELPTLDGQAKPHWELAEEHNLFSLELGVKIAGAGFPLFRGKGAKLQRGLINFFLNEAADAGYEEVMPPLMVNKDTARGTGQWPDKEGQMYFVEKDDLFLIPTAEVPVTNILRDVIVKEDDFPIKFTGHTPCFRREAGSYGAHVRGLNRVHQFDKVEIVQFVHPDKSYEVLQEMCDHVEGLLQKLELPYRILRLCGGDIGFTSALTFDFEVYSAAQKRWLEVSSVSNFETYQSNRMKIRFKDKETKKTRLAHTLNGSALALPRILAALMENNQTADGITIPKVLVPYLGFDKI